MRKLFRNTSIAMLSLVLVLCLASPVYAADGTVTYKGDGQFEFGPGSDMSSTQLFPELEGVMPGDVLTQTITVTNQSQKSDYIKIYLRAEAHDESSNPLETGVKDTETVASMTEFLQQLQMKVTNGGTVIYESTPDQTDGLTDDVLLGSLQNGGSLTLEVEITVPAELGNEYADRSGEVDWVFTVEELNSDASLDLSMTETSKPGNKNGYQEGETITYEIIVTNDGNVTLTDVVVTDPETGETWTIDKLEPGEKVSFNTSHTVTADDVKKGTFTNTASASAKPDNPDLDDVSAGPVKVDSKTYKPGSAPTTGDLSNILLWGGIMAITFAATLLLLIAVRNKKETVSTASKH
ncbi:MAG: hypothetical protein IKT01_00415 [Eubacteriaceae bacterium]|nr:hypothetical protein [Eubacteriaceae bacterium]